MPTPAANGRPLKLRGLPDLSRLWALTDHPRRGPSCLYVPGKCVRIRTGVAARVPESGQLSGGRCPNPDSFRTGCPNPDRYSQARKSHIRIFTTTCDQSPRIPAIGAQFAFPFVSVIDFENQQSAWTVRNLIDLESNSCGYGGQFHVGTCDLPTTTTTPARPSHAKHVLC